MAEALECLNDFKGKFPEQAHSSACDALDKDIKAALFSKSDSGIPALMSAFDFDLQLVLLVIQIHKVGSWNENQTLLQLDTRNLSKALWDIRKQKPRFDFAKQQVINRQALYVCIMSCFNRID